MNERTSPDSVQENPSGTQLEGMPSAHGCHMLGHPFFSSPMCN